MPWIVAPVLVLLTLIVRAPDILPSRFWAEDLPIFLHSAQSDGISSIIQPYAGYFHFIPRTAAYLGTIIPAQLVPDWFLFVTLLITAWCASILARVVGSVGGIAAALALVFASGWSEPIGSITNLQWLVAPTLLVLVLRSKAIPIAEGAVFAATGSLTGPFSIAFAPIYFFQLVREYLSEKNINWIAIIALLGGVIQFACVLLAYEAGNKTGEPNILYALRSLIQLAGGGGRIGVLVFFAVLTICCLGTAKLERISLLIAAVSVAAMAAAKFQYDYQVFSGGNAGHRYWYVSSVLFMICAVLAAKANGGAIRMLAVAIFVVIPVKDILKAGLIRPWPWPYQDWKIAISQSYIAPVEYHFAPNWKILLRDGKTNR